MARTGQLSRRSFLLSRGRSGPLAFRVVDTVDHAPRERYAFWAEAIVGSAEIKPPDADQRRDFRGRITSVGNSDYDFHLVNCGAFTVRRKPWLACNGAEREIVLHYVRKGGFECEQEGDRPVAVAGNQIYLYDGAVPATIACAVSSFIQLGLPRDAILSPSAELPPASRLARALADCALTPMLKLQLEQLSSLVAALNNAERIAALETVKSLAVAAVRSALTRLADGRRGGAFPIAVGSGGLFAVAQRYIETHLDSNDLDPRRIARALGCSRSTLYRAFADRDLSVNETIREVRLCRFRSLLETLPPTVPVGEVAARCGLYDSSNLSRKFRERFGVAPSELRRSSS